MLAACRFVEEGGVHRLAVLGAEVEHVADLDAALDGEHALAVRADGSPSTTLRMSATRSGSGRSRPQLTPVKWKSSALAPQTKSAMRATLRSAMTLTGLLEPDRAEVARLATEVPGDLGLGGEAEAGLQPFQLARLDLVQAWSPRTSSSHTVTP
jgi:hypothetical protein